jgi:rhamnosyltransferase
MKNTKKLEASIIIRTKNEERWIDFCLKKVFDQKEINFEVIILDNNSKDKTVQKAGKFPVKIYKIKKFLPGKALNYGISKSKGKYIVCLSAHCIPEKNTWLKNLIINLKNKKIAGVYGRQKPLSYSSSLDKRDLINVFGPERKIQKKDSFFHNANSAIEKKLLKKFPFDEKTPHIEDRIWAHKMLKKKFHIIYEPNASVFHWHGINQDMNIERCDRIVNIMENIDNEYESKNIHDIKKLKIIAIVPQKGNSITVNNVSLLEKTLNTIKKCDLIEKIYVATDNNNSKKIAKKCGAEIPFIRPKYLSEPYINITTTLKYTLNMLEKKNIIPDIVVVATENFPFRQKNIFENSIKKLIDNNYDIVVYTKEEKGTIFKNKSNKFEVLVNGTIPKKILSEKISICRIGYGCSVRPEVIRSEDLFNCKIGTIKVKNDNYFTEINSKNLRSLNNDRY